MNTLDEIRERGKRLTKRQLQVLQIMLDNKHDDYEGWIFYERGEAWIGDTKIAPRTVYALLRTCAISLIQGDNLRSRLIEHYRINETGENILKAKGGFGRRRCFE